MRGLVIKDLLNLKRMLKQYLFIFIAMAAASVFMKNPSFISMYMILCSCMLIASSFSFDEYAQFDRYVLTLPVSRKDVVKAKYTLFLLLLVVPAVVGIGLSILVNFYIKESSIEELIVVGLSIACVFAMIFCVIIPFMFKLGAEKARAVMLGVYIGVFAVVMLIVQIASKFPNPFANMSEELLYTIILVGGILVTVVSFVISYLASLKIMSKKEY